MNAKYVKEYNCRASALRMEQIIDRVGYFLTFVYLALFLIVVLTSCAQLDAYNHHVAAREDSVTVLPNEKGQYGGEYTHRVEYRAYK